MSARVLVIDDSYAVLRAAEAMLKGYEVETTDNPLLVPSLISTFKPDWILLDFEMPTINGRDVLAAIKNTGLIPTNRIIMFSTSTEADNLVRTYGLAGAAGKSIAAAIRIMSSA